MNFQRVRISLQGDQGSVRVVLCNVPREVLENNPLMDRLLKLYDTHIAAADEDPKEDRA